MHSILGANLAVTLKYVDGRSNDVMGERDGGYDVIRALFLGDVVRYCVRKGR